MITVLQTTEFVKWLKRLKDAEARAPYSRENTAPFTNGEFWRR